MHIPQITPATTIVPISGLDTTIHEVAGVSWHVLLPYSLFGAGLMVYSQVRLAKGQRLLRQQAAGKQTRRPAYKKPQARFGLLSGIRIVVNRADA